MGVEEETTARMILAMALLVVLVSVLGFYVILMQPSEGITGALSTTGTGTATATVLSEASISVTDNDIAFGDVSVGASYDSNTTGTPNWFVVENDGSVAINVTINATKPFTSATTCTSLPCANYQYRMILGEFCSPSEPWVNNTYENQMPATPTQFIAHLASANTNDSFKIFINLTIPSDEPSGSKSSSVQFTASQA
ncbi:MAG: hypothetical protein ABIH99_05445 [Candidatus Micrarchaeota archaeon]